MATSQTIYSRRAIWNASTLATSQITPFRNFAQAAKTRVCRPNKFSVGGFCSLNTGNVSDNYISGTFSE